LDTVKEVLAEAAGGAAVTRNHPGGIKGAQAAALAVFLAPAFGVSTVSAAMRTLPLLEGRRKSGATRYAILRRSP
jgi:hypothetical protein